MKTEEKEQYQQQKKWFKLMELGRLCPAVVPVPGSAGETVKITGATRMALWNLISYTNGSSDSTNVGERRIRTDMQVDRHTLDRAVAALKRAEIVTASQTYDAEGRWQTNWWTIRRDRLEELCGDPVKESVLCAAVERLTGPDADPYAELQIPISRIEQTRSRLFQIAGDVRITITEVASDESTAKLRIELESDALGAGDVEVAADEDRPLTPVTPIDQPQPAPTQWSVESVNAGVHDEKLREAAEHLAVKGTWYPVPQHFTDELTTAIMRRVTFMMGNGYEVYPAQNSTEKGWGVRRRAA